MGYFHGMLQDFLEAPTRDKLWLLFGFAGQALFFMRFIVQWIATEQKRKVVIPLAFWLFSITGAVTLLIYALHLRNPVFILGYIASLGIYSRNVYFHLRHQEAKEVVPPFPGPHSTS